MINGSSMALASDFHLFFFLIMLLKLFHPHIMNSDRQLHKVEIVSTKKKKKCLHNLPLLMDAIDLMTAICCNVFVS